MRSRTPLWKAEIGLDVHNERNIAFGCLEAQLIGSQTERLKHSRGADCLMLIALANVYHLPITKEGVRNDVSAHAAVVFARLKVFETAA